MSAPTLAADGDVGGRTVSRALEDLEAVAVEHPRPTPFATGFDPLDGVLEGGLGVGDLLVLGGKPGQGKTVAALQWARNMAATGHTAIFACYEHDEVTLLARLLACELGEVTSGSTEVAGPRLDALRADLRDVARGVRRVREVLDSDPLLAETEERVRAYSERLVLARASGVRTDLGALDALVEHHEGARVALFVDYLQKVPVLPEPDHEAERVKRVAEGLKDLALRRRVAVVAVAAADQLGLEARRLRLRHMRGSTALAYEADVAVVLNEKVSVVSKAHLAYDTTRAAEFRRQVVFSVEKNRNGTSDVDVEFSKDFANHRFDQAGRWVAERLWEEGAIDE